MSADGGIHVLALTGMPEVVEGDDLAALIGDAIERTVGAAPLTPTDVLVVTQKVVSKAEGAIVDLTGIEPRKEAIAFAERWDRDARQVEVVLREAKRVVRMANGVVITETAHGFVCANGGIDASNVGPASGSIVTLLPVDPDASAAAIRTRIRERFGLDVPVIVSDSFGRPWRWGIVDVAIGVFGTRAAGRPAWQPGCRWPRHALHGPGRRRRDRVGRGAGPRQVGRPARGHRPGRAVHPR